MNCSLLFAVDDADAAAAVAAVGVNITEDYHLALRWLAAVVAGEGSAAGADDTSHWYWAERHCRGNCLICP